MQYQAPLTTVRCWGAQVQALNSLLMVLVLFIFVAATFRAPLPTPLPANLRPNFYGYSAIAVMPVSLVSATIFSEAMWQRCWATATKKCAPRAYMHETLHFTSAYKDPNPAALLSHQEVCSCNRWTRRKFPKQGLAQPF